MISWLQGSGKGLLGLTVGDTLRATTSRHPNNIAINSYHQKQKLTYQELLERSEKFAEGLVGLGM
jgi:fatty-acyl-CoA synthase